ncbi:hypothetical protein N1E22_29050 [Pseudomonas aeruginosa]|uniref:hypothetical protein n=1 Tax=Pseudomonas aeruginosa TaxID=287 RepID=UPI00115CA474|nr:hypothetical protein [Pseudomonas aeruginosa]EKJ8727511.1 hypothetical protein [Pseudomonas aeruginosa]MCS7643122.1 hypothetical protein [Pseudomonas aeruginosa]MCS8501247.1 hypothetical protein [Pseudomonas aeruginosa]MCS9441762.1 hypothetical protein [Pseudomonas aeruginosa]MCS9447611.1 hypothetical protein [Pseudomonas aeruginosa]
MKRFGKAFSGSEQVWVCLTSLHHRRFIEDVLHVIGMPMGARVRLRYRKQYVSNQLWGEVASGRFPCSHVLIALGGTSAAGSSLAIPLRRGEVASAEVQGSVLVVDVLLEDFVFEQNANGRFYDELKLVGKDIPLTFGSSGRGGCYLQKLDAPLTALSSNKDVSGWEKVSEAFWGIDALVGGKTATGVPFLFYINPKDKTKSKISWGGRLTLEMARSYYFDVHTISRNGGEAFKNPIGEVVFEFSNSAASFISSRRVRVDSRRDVKTVGISTAPIFKVEDGHVSIRTISFEYGSADPGKQGDAVLNEVISLILPSKERKEAVLARYDFPLRIGRFMPHIASLLLGVAAGFAVFKLSSSGTITAWDFLAPLIVGVLSYGGLSLGLKKQ